MEIDFGGLEEVSAGIISRPTVDRRDEVDGFGGCTRIVASAGTGGTMKSEVFGINNTIDSERGGTISRSERTPIVADAGINGAVGRN